MSREDHRKYDAALQKMREMQKTQPKPEGFQPKDIIGLCVAGFMGLALLLLAPKLGRGLTAGVLTGMFFSCIYPIKRAAISLGGVSLKKKSFWTGGLVVACAVGISVFGIYVWPPLRRHIFSAQERLKFEEPLIKQSSPRDAIRLLCPQADENACAYAGQFIDFFREAGWTVVGNQVERGLLTKPVSGIILLQPSSGGHLDPSKWNSGLWAAITPSLENVRKAFVNVEVEPDFMVDPRFSSGVLGIYFGPEKEDPSEETALTKGIEEWRRLKNPKP